MFKAKGHSEWWCKQAMLHSCLKAAKRTPAEIHNRLWFCRRADCFPFVCKSHNGNAAKYECFCSAHLSETSISCKCSIIKCSITTPQGTPITLPTTTDWIWTLLFAKLLYWAANQRLVPCLLYHAGHRRCPLPNGSSWLFNRNVTRFWLIFMALIVLEDRQSEGHKNRWCWVLEMTEVDIRMRIKII